MIELTQSQFRVATAIRDGASTIEEISAATGMGNVRLGNVLRALGDVLLVERAAASRGRGRNVAGVIVAVSKAEGFALRAPAERSPYETRRGDRDFIPREPPGIVWPYYGGVHDLGRKR